MKNTDIVDAIGELPEEMIGPVAALRQKKPIRWGHWVALAACICLVLLPLGWQGWNAVRSDDKAEAGKEHCYSSKDTLPAQYEGITDNSACASFRAEVLAVDDNWILVRPLEGEDELRSADKIYAYFEGVKSVPEIKVGDRVEIFYSGMLQETYPASACDVTNIRVVE